MSGVSAVPNPFRGSIVATPWDKAIDVPEIHRDVFDVCCAALEHVHQQGESAGVLIQGSPGSGKTHLLGRLRRHLTSPGGAADLNGRQQAFVWIRLNTNPRWLWRHVRQHFVDDLLCVVSDGLTQLDQLLALRLAERAGGAGDLAQWWEYMTETRMSDLKEQLDGVAADARISQDLLSVLEHWIGRGPKRECRGWLRGESLPDEVLARLGLSVPAGECLSDHDALERQAQETVLALCRLAGQRSPVVFCFDQIEALQVSLEDKGGLVQLGNVIRDLHDSARNALLISCVQADYLNDVQHRIPRYALDAMRSFQSCSIAPLGLVEALFLVAGRLEACSELASLRKQRQLGGRSQAETVWPLSEVEIRGIVGDAGCTPRTLINECARLFPAALEQTEPAAISTDCALDRTWRDRWDQAAAHSDPSQTEHIMADGLPLLMELAAADWSTSEDAAERDLEFVLRAPQGEAKVGVSVCNQQSMTTLAARLRRLKERVAQGDLHKLVVIRDVRFPISLTARATRNYLRDLTADQSHCLLRVDTEAIAALDALRRLLADAQAGDLAVGGTEVTPTTLKEWLTHHLAAPLRDLVEQLTGNTSFEEEELNQELFDRLADLLRERRIISVTEAAKELMCDLDSLIRLAEAASGRFGLIAGTGAVLFDIL